MERGIPAGYKQTEVGVIPQEWEAKRLSDFGAFSKGSGIRKNDADSGPLPCVRYGELYTHHNNIVRTFNSHISQHVARGSKRLRTGDILFAGSGETKEDIGKSAAFVGDCEAYAGGDIVVFTPTDSCSEFLGYALNSPVAQRQKASKAQGDAVVHISTAALAAIQLPCPPLDEQRAIADALGDVDALLGALDRLIAKQRDLKQAAMQRLLTGRTRLPGFTGEREMKRLGDHVTFLTHGTNSRAELMAKGTVKYLHYGDMHGSAGVMLNPGTTRMPYLPEAKARALDRLQDGDLVFADASEDLEGVGRSVELCGVGTTEVVSGMHTIATRFDHAVLANGFKGYLQFLPAFRDHLRRLAAGTKVYATNRAYIASAELALPTVAEQTAIAAVLSDQDAEIAALEARRAKTRDLKQAMLQELLTGRTRLV